MWQGPSKFPDGDKIKFLTPFQTYFLNSIKNTNVFWRIVTVLLGYTQNIRQKILPYNPEYTQPFTSPKLQNTIQYIIFLQYQIVWDACNATCWDILAPSNLKNSTKKSGSVDETAATRQKNHHKFMISNNHLFVPIAAETLGPWCEQEKISICSWV